MLGVCLNCSLCSILTILLTKSHSGCILTIACNITVPHNIYSVTHHRTRALCHSSCNKHVKWLSWYWVWHWWMHKTSMFSDVNRNLKNQSLRIVMMIAHEIIHLSRSLLLSILWWNTYTVSIYMYEWHTLCRVLVHMLNTRAVHKLLRQCKLKGTWKSYELDFTWLDTSTLLLSICKISMI